MEERLHVSTGLIVYLPIITRSQRLLIQFSDDSGEDFKTDEGYPTQTDIYTNQESKCFYH